MMSSTHHKDSKKPPQTQGQHKIHPSIHNNGVTHNRRCISSSSDDHHHQEIPTTTTTDHNNSVLIILQAFQEQVTAAMDQALAAMDASTGTSSSTAAATTTTTVTTTQGDASMGDADHQSGQQQHQQQRLSQLWQLEASFQSALQQRLALVKQNLRIHFVDKSILLRQPEGILELVGSFLDEVSLYHLEESCSQLYQISFARRSERNRSTKAASITANNESVVLPRPPWHRQWQYLDQLRDHSKSSLRLRSIMPHHPPTTSGARSRGLLWTKASRLAEFCENQKLQQQQNQRHHNHHHHHPRHHSSFYERDDFVYDFGRFFQHQPTAPIPSLEFFIRISVPAANSVMMMGSKSSTHDPQQQQQPQRVVVLEGFQSNFMSLRFINELQDQGHHTYIAVGQLVSQAVMVRHNPIQLATAMGLKRTMYGSHTTPSTTSGMASSSVLDNSNSQSNRDSDEDDDEDEEDELDEDDEWPQSRRRAFLNQAAITIIRCGLLPNQQPQQEEPQPSSQPQPRGGRRRSHHHPRRGSHHPQSAATTTTTDTTTQAPEPPTSCASTPAVGTGNDDVDNYDDDKEEDEVDLRLVGTTTGFSSSEQHFAMFQPIRHPPTSNNSTAAAARAGSTGRLQHNLNAIITGNHDDDDSSDNSYFSIDGNDDNYDNDDHDNNNDQTLGIPLADDEMVMLTRDGRLIHQDPDHPHGHNYRLKIGLGCSEGDGLHIVFKWEWD